MGGDLRAERRAADPEEGRDGVVVLDVGEQARRGDVRARSPAT